MQPLRSIIHLILFIGFIAGLSACGGGGDGGSNTTYEYSITSTTYFTGGQQVAVVRYKVLSNSGCTPLHPDPSPTRVGEAIVVNPGMVTVSFTTGITPPIFESVYIDNNASGNLDAGDRVWGDDPTNFYGYCFDTLDPHQAFDWEVEAAQIQALLGLMQPSIIYTGRPQAFRSESDSNPGSMPGKAIAVDGDGYDSTRW